MKKGERSDTIQHVRNPKSEIQNTEVGIFTTDRDFVIRSWDTWMIEATGVPTDVAMGNGLLELFPEIKQSALVKRFEQVLTSGAVEVLSPLFHQYLIPCPAKKPSVYWEKMRQHVTIAPLREKNEIIGAIFTIEDVTERFAMEKQLQDIMIQLASPDAKARIDAVKKLIDQSNTPTEPIHRVLGDENWRVRKAAVEEMIHHYPADQLDALVRDMREKHHDIGFLNSIIQVLSRIGGDVVMPLVGLLNASDNDIRIYAAQALGLQQDRRAIQALIQALEDDDANVQYHAVEALGQLKAVEAAEELITLAEKGDFFLAFPALDALTKVNAAHTAPRIIHLLENPDLGEAAAEALGKLGDASAAEPLTRFLSHPDVPTVAAAKALFYLYDRYETLYKEGLHIADLARNTISETGMGNLIDTVEQTPDSDLGPLCHVLGWLEGQMVEQALVNLIDRPGAAEIILQTNIRRSDRFTEMLISRIETSTIEIQEKIVIALGQIGSSMAVPALTRLLTTVPELAAVTAGALAKIGDTSAADTLFDFLGHPNPAVRRIMVATLNSLGTQTLKEKTIRLLEDPDPNQRESAVRIVEYFGYEEALDTVITLAKDPAEKVRCAVIENIWIFDDPRVFSIMEEALSNDTVLVRCKAVAAFENIEKEKGLSNVLSALEDEASRVRQAGARALGKYQATEATPFITRLAQFDPSPLVKIAAIDALGRIGGAEALQILSMLVKADNPDIAQTAVQALGHIQRPEALLVLKDVLEHSNLHLRMEAVCAVSKYKGKDAALILKDGILKDTDEDIVGAALQELGGLNSAEATEVLFDLSTDASIREDCISAISRMNIENVGLGLRHSHPGARSTLAEALGRMEGPEATEMLVKILEDKDQSVRLKTVKILGDLHSDMVEPKLRKMSRDDPSPVVRLTAEKVISMLK